MFSTSKCLVVCVASLMACGGGGRGDDAAACPEEPPMSAACVAHYRSVCGRLATTECWSVPTCTVVWARPVAARGKGCFDLARIVGCATQAEACRLELIMARDPQGGLWQFATSCMPDGWMVNPTQFTVPACLPPDGGAGD